MPPKNAESDSENQRRSRRGRKGRRRGRRGKRRGKKEEKKVSIFVLRLSANLAITTPLPPLAVTRKPALMTEMMARPSALAIT